MRRLVECVPNFSEGRRADVIEAIASAIRGTPGVRLLDVESDGDHNRSVMTLIGEPEAARSAAFNAAARAVELINMESHRGEHPRLGAVDVVPFIPISGVDMAECVELARALGRELWERLGVPVYFYEEAATSPERRSLADVRRGEYEGRKRDILDPRWRPDVGEPRLHPSAGATVVGARYPLIAFNVNLNTPDVNIAKGIAKKVRERDGGLPAVRALGFEIKERGVVQVSMNLVNYRRTPIWAAYEAVCNEAGRLGVGVLGSELVGLVPLEALAACAERFLKLEGFKTSQILETRLWE